MAVETTSSLPALLDRFDRAIEALRHTHPADGPGFSLMLIADGEVLRGAHHGLADLAWAQPIDGRSRYYLASESKPWVAALVLDAVAAGRLALDDDLRPRLPALQGCDAPVCAGHLLRHTSGLDDYLFLWRTQLGRGAHDVVDNDHALELIRRAGEANFTPGTCYDYCNTNYLLLAEWLQHDAGCSLATLAERRFFEPWGLKDTAFDREPWRVMPRRLRSYGAAAHAPGAWQELPVNLATWGDGGLWSTPDDLARAERHWLDDWRRHGAASLLARCAHDDPRFAPAGQAYRFGIEWQTTAEGQPLLFHGGAYAGFSSLLLRCPEAARSLVVLSNAEGFDASLATWAGVLLGSATAGVAGSGD